MDMTNLKVVEVGEEHIVFNNGVELYSHHYRECCENHFLSFRDLTLEDFEGLSFDLSNDNFFSRIEDYGIELLPTNGFSVRIPGYGYNNGYYSSDMSLIITDNKDFEKIYDITECQNMMG